MSRAEIGEPELSPTIEKVVPKPIIPFTSTLKMQMLEVVEDISFKIEQKKKHRRLPQEKAKIRLPARIHALEWRMVQGPTPLQQP
jgi:hypothetical protein